MTSDVQATATGGCLCGSVRYTVTGAPLFVAVCHCRHCQRQSGSALSVNCAFASADYVETGNTHYFEDVGESGQPVFRCFCPECGSPIISVLGSMPGLVVVKAGTFDDPTQFVPTLEVHCSRALPWMPALASTARFVGPPELSLEQDAL